MADALSIKLRCASWQQLATIYRRDLVHGTMFLKAATPPTIGTEIHIDLTLPSGSVIAMSGAVAEHVQDPQRGAGVSIKLAPIAAHAVWMIESALGAEQRRIAQPPGSGPITTSSAISSVAQLAGTPAATPAHQVTGIIPTIPSMQDGAEVSAAERELLRALSAEAESLKKLNPFLVLGVGYEATDAEVRAAFGDLTKRYHPDRFARYESSELREVAAEIFILIRDAYRRLGDVVSRSQALQALGKAAPPPRAVPAPPRPLPAVPPPTPRGQRVTSAQAHAVGVAPTAPISTIPPPDQPGSAPISTSAPLPLPTLAPPTTHMPHATVPPPKQSGPAFPRAGTASQRRPLSSPPLPAQDQQEIATFEEMLDHGRLDDALDAYKNMAKRHPSDRNVRAGIELCEGLMALAVRDRLEAAQRFEAALEIDPSNERAARELADMRRLATNERKGLLSRLMGKKEP